jgi:hypothetical protein
MTTPAAEFDAANRDPERPGECPANFWLVMSRDPEFRSMRLEFRVRVARWVASAFGEGETRGRGRAFEGIIGYLDTHEPVDLRGPGGSGDPRNAYRRALLDVSVVPQRWYSPLQAMRRVVIESPYAGDVARNVAYARRCVLDCLRRGEAPYASHLFFTQEGLLDDLRPEERQLGIEAGLAWGEGADLVAFYLDLGVSSGMRRGYRAAMARDALVEARHLDLVLPGTPSEVMMATAKMMQQIWADLAG